MINSIADLLKDFVNAEVAVLNKQDIKHPPTIGSMYEGLTKEIFNKSIFNGLDLRVVNNSFIKGCNTEFDVMLVIGKGDKIPYIESFKYNPENVIAIVQSKKNLYSKDIRESHDNLKFLIEYYKEIEGEQFHLELLNDSFRGTCRKHLFSRESEELTFEEEYVYESLRIDALLPVRIIWGYNGFKSESNLRESFYEYISDNITTNFKKPTKYFGPHNFANLTICGDFSIIKNNGMPFISPMKDDNYWPFLTTSSYNPTKYFLEVIWTRLSYKFKLPMEIFGEDLELEPSTRFIDGRVLKIENSVGWELNYTPLSNTFLKKNSNPTKWKPAVLDEIQFVVISRLCREIEIDIENNIELENYVLNGRYNSFDEFIQKLKETGLITILGKKLMLLTDECGCIILPDGRYIAGENKSGRLINWLSANEFK